MHISSMEPEYKLLLKLTQSKDYSNQLLKSNKVLEVHWEQDNNDQVDI